MEKTSGKKLLFALMILAAILAAVLLFVYYLPKSGNRPYLQIRGLFAGRATKPEAVLQQPDLFPANKQDNFTTVPILMYHHIGNIPVGSDNTQSSLTVSTEEFGFQVKWLKENGYQSATLQELYNFLQGGKINWPKKSVIFSFDDGYADALENAVPILKKYGFTGTFGIITQFPGTVSGYNVYASWQQIAQTKEQGMEIVCHTQNHFDGSNPKFSPDYIYNDLKGCQEDIRNHLGSAEPFLVYPYGHYTADYIKQAKKAGFNMALTVHEGKEVDLNNLMMIPRIRVSGGESLEKFIKLITE